MNAEQAQQFGMVIAVPIVVFVMFVAVFLLGFSMLKDMTR